jgi:hypothetical protein
MAMGDVVADLYGDESCGSAIVVYGFVLIPAPYPEAA